MHKYSKNFHLLLLWMGFPLPCSFTDIFLESFHKKRITSEESTIAAIKTFFFHLGVSFKNMPRLVFYSNKLGHCIINLEGIMNMWMNYNLHTSKTAGLTLGHCVFTIVPTMCLVFLHILFLILSIIIQERFLWAFLRRKSKLREINLFNLWHFISCWAQIQTEAGFLSIPAIPHSTGTIIAGYSYALSKGAEKKYNRRA